MSLSQCLEKVDGIAPFDPDLGRPAFCDVHDDLVCPRDTAKRSVDVVINDILLWNDSTISCLVELVNFINSTAETDKS